MQNAALYLKRLLNGLLFYVGWFVCVYSAAQDHPYYATIGSILIVAIHFALFQETAFKDLILLLSMLLFGFILDTIFVLSGLIEFHSPNPWRTWESPIWVLGLHAIFATTINHSLSWLKPYPIRAAFLGAAGGGLTYVAGQRMGAVDFLLPDKLSPVIIGAAWFLYTPALYAYANWLDEKL